MPPGALIALVLSVRSPPLNVTTCPVDGRASLHGRFVAAHSASQPSLRNAHSICSKTPPSMSLPIFGMTKAERSGWRMRP